MPPGPSGLGPGMSLTTLAFLVLLYSLWQSWLVVRTGRAIDSPARPSRGETARRIKRSLLADLLGLVLALLGYQALAGSLFVQASMQTPGIAIQVDNLAITATEIVVVLGNAQALFAHLIGLLFSLWLLQRIYPHQLIRRVSVWKACQGAAPEQIRLDRGD